MNGRLFPLLLLQVLILSWPVMVFAQDMHDLQSVQAEGRAAIVGSNIARAQREAIQDALKTAVENSIAQWLSPEIITRKTNILKEKVYSAADAYIQTYKIVAELPSQKVYTVNLIARVDYTALKDDLKALGITVAAGAPRAVTFSLTVHGIRNPPDYARLVNVLRGDVAGIKDVRIRRAWQGSVRLDLDMEGAMPSLADKLGKTGKFSFHLNQISEKEVEITLLD